MGTLSAAYDLFCIIPVMKLMGRIYYCDEHNEGPGVMPPAIVSAMTAITLAGTIIGQLPYGVLGKWFGRWGFWTGSAVHVGALWAVHSQYAGQGPVF